MNAVQTVAIARAVKEAAARSALAKVPEGSVSPVDITVRIVGEVVRGMGTTKRPTSNLLSVAVVAKALVYAGVTAEAIKVALRRAAMEAIATGTPVADKLEAADARVAAAIKEVQDDVIATLPEVPVAGAVKFNGTITEVNTSTVAVELAVAA
jgi:hypothetical protein